LGFWPQKTEIAPAPAPPQSVALEGVVKERVTRAKRRNAISSGFGKAMAF